MIPTAVGLERSYLGLYFRVDVFMQLFHVNRLRDIACGLRETIKSWHSPRNNLSIGFDIKLHEINERLNRDAGIFLH
jgi:hypothetical protein